MKRIFLVSLVLQITISQNLNRHLSKEKDNTHEIINLLDDYLNQKTHDNKKLQKVMESGLLNGHFSAKQIQGIFKYLSERHKEFVKTEKFGETFQGRDLNSYHLSDNLKDESKKKSIILFTGAHHARELISPGMTVKIFVETLHSLIHKDQRQQFWKFNDVLIVPIVNLDSYHYISDAWGTPNWDTNKLKRKNMNRTSKQLNCSEVSSGIDLNRNYGYHYRATREDNYPCSETYNGDVSFSEKET